FGMPAQCSPKSQGLPPPPRRGDKMPYMPWSMPVGKMSVEHARALITDRVIRISTVTHNSALRFPKLRHQLPELVPLHRWLDSWKGLGDIVSGLNAQGLDLELRQFPRGWRAKLYTGTPRSIVVAPAWEPTPWRAIQQAAWLALSRQHDPSDDLHEFVTDQGGQGLLTPTTSPITPNGYRLEVACPCGVTFERWVTPLEAAEELALEHLRAGTEPPLPPQRGRAHRSQPGLCARSAKNDTLSTAGSAVSDRRAMRRSPL